MVKKKAKEEAAQSIQPKAETSNREESSSNSMAVAAKNEEQPKEQLKLHVLAADRLNRLVDEANELGITDVVQILSSDKYNQFYMVYRA